MGPSIFATWNVQKCVGLDFRRDPERCARVIATLKADVVALQEVDKRLGPRPAALTHGVVERLTHLRPVEIAVNDVSIGWHGNAILVSDAIEVSRVVHIDLPGLEPRGAVMADLHKGDEDWRVVACHLGLLRRDRRRQFAKILSVVEERPRLATVIMGDMNEWSRKKGLEALHDFDVVMPGNSFHSRRPIAPLDRIAIGPGVTAGERGVLKTTATRVASDHLPVWVRLEQDRAADHTTTSISS